MPLMNNPKGIKIKSSIKNRPFLFISTIILFLAITSILNKTYLTLPKFFSTFKPIFSIPFILINIILIPLLVATTITLSVERINQAKSLSGKKGFFGAIGTVLGILGGACPGCFVGLFPAAIGIFGITASVGALPLYGFELGLISIVFLIISINYLSKDNVCKIKPKTRQ